MRAIVTGSGSIAARHVRNLHTLFPDVAIALVTRPEGSGLPPALAPLVREHHTDLTAALAQPADLAIIATPAPSHVIQALALVARDIPTLIEKPLAMSLLDCDRLVALGRQRNVPILVGYCLRYHPLFIEMQARLQAGAIGRVYNLRAEVGQYLPGWRPGTDYRKGVSAQRALGGGALLELSHEIDLVRALIGMPQDVTAITGRVSELEIDVEDVAEIVLRHKRSDGGVLASIHLDLFRRIPRRRLIVDGDAGMMELDIGAAKLTLQRQGGAPEAETPPEGFAINDLYLAEIRDLLSGQPPRAGLADGLATLRIVLAAAESAAARHTIALES